MRPTWSLAMPLGRIPSSSYYDKNYRPTAALNRARAPYLVKNALTGLCLLGFVGAIYSWTLKAVGQDDFSDIPIPDAPAQTAHAPNASAVKSAGNTS